MNLRDLKSLNSIISEVTKPETQDKSRMIQEGFGNSLSAKARQVVHEQVEGSRGPNPQGKPVKVKPATGSVGIEADRIKRDGQAAVARLARKALKRAKKKAATNEEAELDLAEGVNAKRLRVLRKHVKDDANPMSPEVKDFMARSFKKTTNANKTRIAPGGSAVKAMEVRMRKKHSAMKEKGLAESDQLDELSPELLGRYIQAATHDSANAAYRAGKLNKPRKQSKEEDALIKKVFKREKGIGRAASKLISDKRGFRFKIVTESDQLDEAGYKRLMRIKKAAYKAGQKGSPSHGRKMRAAAELTTKVAANMARRGGASADAVRGDGSLRGKRGTFSQKAIKLSNQRDKALAKFRGKAAEGKRWASKYSSADKRALQQRYAKFDNQSRSGDFGQNNQAAMRTTYDYLKRTGKISEELAGLIEAAPKKALPKPKKKPIVKKPIVDWSAYDKWKKRLSPAAAAKENKRIADVHKLFKLSRSEKEVAKRNEQGQSGSGRGGFDGGHGPSPGSRWI